jgi:hypothetical protein
MTYGPHMRQTPNQARSEPVTDRWFRKGARTRPRPRACHVQGDKCIRGTPILQTAFPHPPFLMAGEARAVLRGRLWLTAGLLDGLPLAAEPVRRVQATIDPELRHARNLERLRLAGLKARLRVLDTRQRPSRVPDDWRRSTCGSSRRSIASSRRDKRNGPLPVSQRAQVGPLSAGIVIRAAAPCNPEPWEAHHGGNVASGLRPRSRR